MTRLVPGATIRRTWHRLGYLVDAPAVLGWLVVVEIGLRLVTLPRVASWVGVPLERTSEAASRSHLRVSEWRRLRALDYVAPRWPFCDGPCLRQALVAGRILRRHHPVLRIGVAMESSDVIGHAWVQVGDVEIGRSDRFATLDLSSRT